jgi:hypothetical protein
VTSTMDQGMVTLGRWDAGTRAVKWGKGLLLRFGSAIRCWVGLRPGLLSLVLRVAVQALEA